MHQTINNWIILGKDEANNIFRPSDWAARLCELGATVLPRGSVKYSKNIIPIRHDGHIAVYVDAKLKDENLGLWEHVMHFAKSNNLVVLEYHNPLSTFEKHFKALVAQLEEVRDFYGTSNFGSAVKKYGGVSSQGLSPP